MIKACAETMLLNNWWFPFNHWVPGPANSIRINTESAVPNRLEKKANKKYNTAISLALVDINQRLNIILIK